MSDVLSFYFDGAIVQAVKVRITGIAATAEEARTFPYEELDDFLSTCREKNCIICCNPQFFYQDIVHLPPNAIKHYDRLIRSEIQSMHPDLTSFSLFHHTVGESIIDAKPFSKIAVFCYQDDFLSDFISSLGRFGKKVVRVYSAPYAIFRLALTTCTTDLDHPRIFIASLPGEKLLLVCENNELEFIRKIPSLNSTLLPEDSNNINMTVDYCFQSLRVKPSEAVIINPHELPEDLSPLLSVPFRATLPRKLTGIPPYVIQDYIAPVAAALHYADAPRSGNILPKEYSAFMMRRKLLTTMTMIMVVLILLLGGFLVKELATNNELNSKISRIRTGLSGSANELAAFRKLDEEVIRLKQPLEIVNKHNTSLNPAAALAALNLPESREYVIREVTVQNSDTGINVQLQGAINASIYSDTQEVFEKFVARFAKLSGYSIVSSAIDIRQKTFSIQARYKSGGQPGK